MRKLTTKEFIKRAKKIHGDKYDYSETEYKTAKEKVVIICPLHGKFKQSAWEHMKGSGCIKCGNKKSNEAKLIPYNEVIKRFKKSHGNKYDYSKMKYKGKCYNVEIVCPKHGSFFQIPVNHWDGHGCPKCGGSEPLNKELFIERSRKIHGNKYDYSKVNYENARTKVCIVCKNDGEEFWQTPGSHMNGNGCPKCAGKLINTEEFVKRSKKIHGNKYDYSKSIYKTAKEKVIIICPLHGYFEQLAYNHMKGCGCPKCSLIISHKSQKWLDGLKIPEKNREKYIKIGKNKYYVDALDKKNKIVYEFHGDFWHGNPKIYNKNDINPVNKKTFGELYKKTLEKEKNIKNAGYELVSIWEYDYDIKLKNILPPP